MRGRLVYVLCVLHMFLAISCKLRHRLGVCDVCLVYRQNVLVRLAVESIHLFLKLSQSLLFVVSCYLCVTKDL